jgi:hypothetical protein
MCFRSSDNTDSRQQRVLDLMSGKSNAAGPTTTSSVLKQQQQCQQQQPQPTTLHKSTLQFTDPEAEQQFQQSFAAGRRLWDAAAVLTTLLALVPLLELAFSQDAQLCSATTSLPRTGSPRHLLKAVWWCQPYWRPAITSYGITSSLEGAVAMLCSIATTVWLLWTLGVVSTPGAAYSKQRTLLMRAWRVGRSLTGVLVLVAYHLQQQAGWCAQTAQMPRCRSTMCAVTRLLWPAHFLSVSVSAGLARC